LRLYDAYRRGFLTYSEYQEMLAGGLTANSSYTPGVPAPIPDVPVSSSGTTTNIPVLTYALDTNTVTAYSVNIVNTGLVNSLSFRIDRIVGDEVIDSLEDYIIANDTFYVNLSSAVDHVYVYVWSKVSEASTTFVVGGSVIY
jgi:hypothetical protein